MTVVIVVDRLAIAEDPASWPAPGSAVIVAPGLDVTVAVQVVPAEATHLVVLASRGDQAHAGIVANVAAGARPELAVAVRAYDATPLALAAIASAALEAAPDPATMIAAIESRLADARWGVWLPKIAKLDQPAPSLVQHLRSLLPGGSGYVARMGPGGTVVNADEAGALAAPDEVFLIGAAPDTAEHARLTTLAGHGSPVTVPPITSTKRRYGAPGAEFVTMKESQTVQRTVVTCPVCELPVHGDSCAFCHVVPGTREAA